MFVHTMVSQLSDPAWFRKRHISERVSFRSAFGWVAVNSCVSFDFVVGNCLNNIYSRW
jgi:hypothetical protein